MFLEINSYHLYQIKVKKRISVKMWISIIAVFSLDFLERNHKTNNSLEKITLKKKKSTVCFISVKENNLASDQYLLKCTPQHVLQILHTFTNQWIFAAPCSPQVTFIPTEVIFLMEPVPLSKGTLRCTLS